MRVDSGKIIISKHDLNRKVIIVRNAKSEEELQMAQVAAMQSSPGCLVIKEESFKKYNDFRHENKKKRLLITQVMVMDLREFEQQENFKKFKNNGNADKNNEEKGRS